MFALLLVVIVVLCAALANAGSVNLTHTTLNQQIGAHKTLVVMYYAPWCSYSKEALPIWEELADSMARNSEDKNILVAKVDCVAEPDAYWQENIKSFPTIKAYVNHNTIPIVYDGERIANTMWRYFRILNKQYVEEITTLEEFLHLQTTKLTATKPLVLAMLSSEDSLTDDNVRNRKIDGACKKADRVTCVISRNVELGAALGLTFPSVTIFTAFEPSPIVANDVEVYQQAPIIDMPVSRTDLDELSGSDLADWLTNLSYPPLIELTAESSDLVFSQQRAGFENHFLFLLHNVASEQGQQRLENIRTIGRSFQGKGVVIYIDMTNLSPYCAEVLQSLQVDTAAHHQEDGAPLDTLHAVVSKTSTMNFYSGLHLNSAFAEGHGVVAWMEGVLAGLVAPERTTTHEQ